MHKTEKEEKEKNLNTLQEVAKAVATIEEQLKALKTNVKGLESKISESDAKIDEEITIS
jgi:peptidoglycan hydrolase CwlO-like protein